MVNRADALVGGAVSRDEPLAGGEATALGCVTNASRQLPRLGVASDVATPVPPGGACN